MATIPGIQARLSNAVKQLINADRENPNTLLTAEQIRANPYMKPKGDNGAVDKSEAKTVESPFARSVFEAASMEAGEAIEEGGTDSLKPSVLPAWEVGFGDLRATQSHLNAIVASLQTDETGNVTQAALDGLPKTVADYYRGMYSNTRDLPPQVTMDKIAALVREAATGVVDWR